jgi:hypothetical protein
MGTESTDEILCSSCGRPNLKEAVKCWYCQMDLEKPAKEENDGEPLSEDRRLEEDQQSDAYSDRTQSEASEDIPEWLKRIRELKKADQQAEEEKDQWQQQRLFGTPESKRSGKPHKKESTNPAHQKPDKTQDPLDEDKQPHLEEKPPEEKPAGKAQPEIEDDEIEPSTEDLPEGFVRFKPKSD